MILIHPPISKPCEPPAGISRLDIRSFFPIFFLLYGFNSSRLAASCHSGEPRIRSGAGAGIQEFKIDVNFPDRSS
jgi:hypothetical protein